MQSYQENDWEKPSSIAFPVREILFNAAGGIGAKAELYLSYVGDIEHYPYGEHVKNVIIEIMDSRAQNMSFYYLRPFPLEEYHYAGSIATFTMDTMYHVVDGWRGTPYVGYQAPYFWLDCEEEGKLQENLEFMNAAQEEYESKTGNSGFFAPVFIWDRWDSREYGTQNTFSREGPDPNTHWGGFQYRAVEAAARTWRQAPDVPLAKGITMKFLSAVNSRWNSGADPIFTTFTEDGTISSYGDEPQMTALLMRASLYAYEASVNEEDTQSQAIAEALIDKCMVNLEKCHVEEGVIKGTWGGKNAIGQDMWYSFWGGEVLTTLSKGLSTKGSGKDEGQPGSPSYMEILQTFLDDFAANEAWKYGINAAQMTAAEGINKVMLDINNYGNTDEISEYYWIILCKKFNNLVWQYGSVFKELHYFRNELNRAPETLDEMIKTIQRSSSDKKWRLLTPDNSIYHMYGTYGEYNLKFVSSDGLFEAVYNKMGTLLTASNDAVNMGTYNYADPEANSIKHFLLDVEPYYLWGNIVGVPKSEGEVENLNRFNNNADAQNNYDNIYSKINGN